MLLDHMTEAEKKARFAEEKKVREEYGLDSPPEAPPSVEEKPKYPSKEVKPTSQIFTDPSEEWGPALDGDVKRWKAIEDKIDELAKYGVHEPSKKEEIEAKLKEFDKAKEEAQKNWVDFMKTAIALAPDIIPGVKLQAWAAYHTVLDKAYQENPDDPRIYLLREVAKTLGDPAATFADSAKGAAQHINDTVNGIIHGIFGGGDPYDVEREKAAVQATATTLMPLGMVLAGPATMAAGAAGAAAAGGLTLGGWWMADNLTFQLSNKVNEAKKQLTDELNNIKYLERREEAKRKELELEEESWNERMEDLRDYLEEKKKVEEEIQKMKEEAREKINKYYEELERKKAEEEKAQEEAIKRYREFESAVNKIKDRLSAAKEIIQAAENAYFNKNRSLAQQLLGRALDKVFEAKDIAQSNSQILKEYNSFEWVMDGIQGLIDIIEAKSEAWAGRNPTTKHKKAVINAAKNYYRRTQDRATKYDTSWRFSLSDPEGLKVLLDDYREEVKGAALLDYLKDSFNGLAELSQIYLEKRSPLRPETIIKFREWLAKNIKTPLAKIPNYKWNQAEGYSYDSDMMRLMIEGLRDAGVALEEVGMLSPKELEAILRARQYIYAAVKRGYFLPYEYELYDEFKRLLMLTDYQAAKLLRLYIPFEKVAGGGGGTQVA